MSAATSIGFSAPGRYRHMAASAVAALLLVSIAAALILLRSELGGAVASPNPVDIGFAQAMGVHHDQAVLMSQILLRGQSSALADVALSMQTAQLLQMGQMRGWLQLWGAPSLPGLRGMDWMLLGREVPDAALAAFLARCAAEPGTMPGLSSSEELNRLRGASARERDVLFLQLMIRHHLAALPMARFAANNAATEAVRALASRIANDQGNELRRLSQLLGELQRMAGA